MLKGHLNQIDIKRKNEKWFIVQKWFCHWYIKKSIKHQWISVFVTSYPMTKQQKSVSKEYNMQPFLKITL